MYIEQYKSSISKFCKQYGVRTLYAFGSVLTDKFNDRSDIDLIVDIDSSNPLDYADKYFELKFAMQDTFIALLICSKKKLLKIRICAARLTIPNNLSMQDSRNIKIYLQDISQAISEIWAFLPEKRNFLEFQNDLKTRKAVERNIEIIGEAMSRILKIAPNFPIDASHCIFFIFLSSCNDLLFAI